MTHTITFTEEEISTLAYSLIKKREDFHTIASKLAEGQLKQHYLDEAKCITEVLSKVNEVVGTKF